MVDDKAKIKEILKIGIVTEINGERFYRNFAQMVTLSETKGKIEHLAHDEVIHRQVLEKIYSEQFHSRPEDLPDKGIGVFEKVLHGHRLSKEATVPGLLDIAIEAESATRDYYADGEKIIPDESVKAVFRRLALEEDGHFNLLTAEKNALSGLEWFNAGASGEFEY
ncbi:MAG: hypothetical protein CO189_06790 [candidate division Zixibacteria bacterium CG_4_9_14_3_um_filter_46_8]|nr:MAG: hypothetical protein CO189_06790 [candidate division Zixibacteria bacterium CG_4_9_14_3_um_filter_46_8]